ncbi:ABC transporter substrate-binding protein [Gryllotalpicola ginsengisoli]|uniref:ABC transporter substrate-binding protein n=1 Tax=Gryllotalpicola ginsengisoli TaxID=444608 RepID=UPI0003B55D79|nr:extracellular solute-binding protein [Gryllotalpicola ginsengisoli]
MATQITRRQLGFLALAGLGTLSLAGCGTGAASTGSSAADAYKTAKLTFSWWGNDVRNAYTQKLLDLYHQKHGKISFTADPGEWNSYWTKLSTHVAANDAPDIIQMDWAYIAEYGGRGALADLSQQEALDTSKLDDDAMASGTYQGKLYGVSTGRNAMCVAVNERILKEAGAELPDDGTWTWDDYQELAQKISDSTGGKTVGTSLLMQDSDAFIWARQNGEQLFTKSGKVGLSEENATAWFERWNDIVQSGAGPTPDQWTQDVTLALEQSLFGTGKAGMAWIWTNQLAAYEQATGDPITMLRPPSATGKAADNGAYFKSSMFWSMSSRTKAPAQASAVIDWLVNSTEAGKVILAERGIPTNSDVLSAITPQLADADKAGVALLDKMKPDIKDTPPVPPKGTSTATDVIRRHATDVFFKRAKPAAAAKAVIDELTAQIKQAS